LRFSSEIAVDLENRRINGQQLPRIVIRKSQVPD